MCARCISAQTIIDDRESENGTYRHPLVEVARPRRAWCGDVMICCGVTSCATNAQHGHAAFVAETIAIKSCELL